MRLRLLLPCCITVASGCMTSATPPSSAPDAAVEITDAGNSPPDANVADAHVPDAHTPDAQHPDGGVRDSGAPDSAVDAGYASFEACCVDVGCGTQAGTELCMAYPAAYGACTVSGVAGQCVDIGQCSGTWVNTAGFCPGPSAIQCCTPTSPVPDAGVDDGGWSCSPADMPVPNAGLQEPTLDDKCPAGMRRAGATVCVDAWEAFVREESPDGGLLEWSPYFNPGTRLVHAFSAPGAVPQGYINGEQAQAACIRAGKRLCTDAEWLRACRGPSSLTFPYGNTRMPGTCNDARAQHPAVELFPDDPTPFDRIQESCINQLPDSVDTTGANPGCVTSEGHLDMMGNLHEWTADPNGTFRGGFYVDTSLNGPGCLYVTTAHNTLHWDYSTGFRCCADALP